MIFAITNKLQCTYIEVDQVATTFPVVLSKPGWMWGAEMGANSQGVVIGNEAVWSSYEPEPILEKRLLGMDLLRLGLERGGSAREALNWITILLEKYGQGGPCSNTDKGFAYYNSFLITDSTEAYVLETAGRLWAAERVTTGHRNISNCYSIRTQIDLSSPNLKEEAQKAGLWHGSGDFDFAQVFSGEKNPGEPRFTNGKKLLSKLSADATFDVSAMMKVLRDEKSGICRSCSNPFPTASSQVSAISSDLKRRPACHWFTGTPDPSKSVFKPFIFTAGCKKLSSRTASSSDRSSFKHYLYQLHESKYDLLSDERNGAPLRQSLTATEANCLNDVERALDSFDGSKETEQELAVLFDDLVDAEICLYK